MGEVRVWTHVWVRFCVFSIVLPACILDDHLYSLINICWWCAVSVMLLLSCYNHDVLPRLWQFAKAILIGCWTWLF